MKLTPERAKTGVGASEIAVDALRITTSPVPGLGRKEIGASRFPDMAGDTFSSTYVPPDTSTVDPGVTSEAARAIVLRGFDAEPSAASLPVVAT
jgi:hypothetical protein